MFDDDDGVDPQIEDVNEYYFKDSEGEAVCFSILPFQFGENENEADFFSKKDVFLHGFADKSLLVYKEVVAWKIRLDSEQPNIFVFSTKNEWIKLLKPRKCYEEFARSILITVQMLHFARRGGQRSGLNHLWDHLDEVFGKYNSKPAEDDLMKHHTLIKLFVEKDQMLMKSKILKRFIENGFERTKKALGTEAQFIVNDRRRVRKHNNNRYGNKDIGDGCDDGDSSSDDTDYSSDAGHDSSDADDDSSDADDDSSDADDDSSDDEATDQICAICDDGGQLLSCEGPCKRSFHPTEEDGIASECKTLGYTSAEVKRTGTYLCPNCKNKQHQCFRCGELEPSHGPNAKFGCTPECTKTKELGNSKGRLSGKRRKNTDQSTKPTEFSTWCGAESEEADNVGAKSILPQIVVEPHCAAKRLKADPRIEQSTIGVGASQNGAETTNGHEKQFGFSSCAASTEAEKRVTCLPQNETCLGTPYDGPSTKGMSDCSVQDTPVDKDAELDNVACRITEDKYANGREKTQEDYTTKETAYHKDSNENQGQNNVLELDNLWVVQADGSPSEPGNKGDKEWQENAYGLRSASGQEKETFGRETPESDRGMAIYCRKGETTLDNVDAHSSELYKLWVVQADGSPSEPGNKGDKERQENAYRLGSASGQEKETSSRETPESDIGMAIDCRKGETALDNVDDHSSELDNLWVVQADGSPSEPGNMGEKERQENAYGLGSALGQEKETSSRETPESDRGMAIDCRKGETALDNVDDHSSELDNLWVAQTDGSPSEPGNKADKEWQENAYGLRSASGQEKETSGRETPESDRGMAIDCRKGEMALDNVDDHSSEKQGSGSYPCQDEWSPSKCNDCHVAIDQDTSSDRSQKGSQTVEKESDGKKRNLDKKHTLREDGRDAHYEDGRNERNTTADTCTYKCRDKTQSDRREEPVGRNTLTRSREHSPEIQRIDRGDSYPGSSNRQGCEWLQSGNSSRSVCDDRRQLSPCQSAFPLAEFGGDRSHLYLRDSQHRTNARHDLNIGIQQQTHSAGCYWLGGYGEGSGHVYRNLSNWRSRTSRPVTDKYAPQLERTNDLPRSQSYLQYNLRLV